MYAYVPLAMYTRFQFAVILILMKTEWLGWEHVIIILQNVKFAAAFIQQAYVSIQLCSIHWNISAFLPIWGGDWRMKLKIKH